MCGSLKLLSSTANLLRSLKWTSQSFWTIQAIHQTNACRWNNVVRVFHVFCAPPCFLNEKRSLNPLSTPAMSLLSWPRPETGQSQQQLGQSDALKRQETSPLLEASWQLFFWLHHGLCQCSVQGSELPDTFFLQNPIYHKISTSCQHFKCSSPVSSPVTCFGMTCPALLSALPGVPSGWRRWRRLCSAQAVDFGAFLVHGREHGIWRVPKQMLMEIDGGCWCWLLVAGWLKSNVNTL